MTISEKLQYYHTLHSVNLEKLKLSSIREVMKLYKRLRDDLVAEIAKIDPTDPLRQSARNQRTEKLLQQSNIIIAQGYAEIQKRAGVEMKDAAVFETGFAQQAINRSVGIELATVAVPTATLNEIVKDTVIQGAASRMWWKRQSGALQNRFADTIRMHMLRSSTLNDIVRAIRGTRENNYTDGIMVSSTRDAEALIRTSVQTVANRAAEEFYRENDDVIQGYIWISTLDDRTTEICMVRDGLQYDLNYEPIGHSIPWLEGPGAIHWNCRSRSMPALKDYKGMSKAKQEAIRNAGVRSSQFGYVKRNVRYEAWLKEQDQKRPGFADRVLGTDKARLWRGTGLSLRDLVNGDGKSMTAEALRSRYASEWKTVFQED
jgi:SPP1 gp7 family putative phage head morphogenesis protein